ncbi:MAG TPA: hypothetical protein VF881_06035 [Polyangiaceae bacterium]
MRSVVAATSCVFLVVVLAFLIWPASIEPAAWEPLAKPPLVGAWAPNEELTHARLLAKGELRGPEDVAIDSEGRLYGGTIDGKIVRIRSDGAVEDFAATGGRPLGLRFAPDGTLIWTQSC